MNRDIREAADLVLVFLPLRDKFLRRSLRERAEAEPDNQHPGALSPVHNPNGRVRLREDMLVVSDPRPGNDRPSVRKSALICVETVDLQIAAALRRVDPHLSDAHKRNVRSKISILVIGNMERVRLAEAISPVYIDAGIPVCLLCKEFLRHERGCLLREADRMERDIESRRRATFIFDVDLRVIRVKENCLRSGTHTVCLQLRNLQVLAVNGKPVKVNIAEALGRIDPDALRPADVDLTAEGPVLILIDRDCDLFTVPFSRIEIDLSG